MLRERRIAKFFGGFKVLVSLSIIAVSLFLLRSPYPASPPKTEGQASLETRTSWEHKISRVWKMEITKLGSIIDGFENEVASVRNHSAGTLKVAIAYNSNLDYIFQGIDLLKALAAEPSGKERFADHEIVHSIEELEQAFSFYFSIQGGAERFFSDKKLFDEKIVPTAAKLERLETFVGGNAALMSTAMAEDGVRVLLGGPIGPELRALLKTAITADNHQIEIASDRSSDEVHMIAEYQLGQKWGDLTVSGRGNRFIFSSDIQNSQFQTVEEFHNAAVKFNADALVLSGLHMLVGQSEDIVSSSMDMICKNVDEVKKDVPIHWELASMADLKLLARVSKQMLKRVDSLGLNEQELAGLHSALLGTEYIPVAGVPEAHETIDRLKYVMNMFPDASGEGEKDRNHELSRIQFHCAGYHIVVVRKSSPSSIHWKNARASVAQASLIAAKRAGDKSTIAPGDVFLKCPEIKILNNDGEVVVKKFKVEDPFIEWEDGDLAFTIAPSLLVKKLRKTVGLGDTISSMGFLYHVKQS